MMTIPKNDSDMAPTEPTKSFTPNSWSDSDSDSSRSFEDIKGNEGTVPVATTATSTIDTTSTIRQDIDHELPSNSNDNDGISARRWIIETNGYRTVPVATTTSSTNNTTSTVVQDVDELPTNSNNSDCVPARKWSIETNNYQQQHHPQWQQQPEGLSSPAISSLCTYDDGTLDQEPPISCTSTIHTNHYHTHPNDTTTRATVVGTTSSVAAVAPNVGPSGGGFVLQLTRFWESNNKNTHKNRGLFVLYRKQRSKFWNNQSSVPSSLPMSSMYRQDGPPTKTSNHSSHSLAGYGKTNQDNDAYMDDDDDIEISLASSQSTSMKYDDDEIPTHSVMPRPHRSLLSLPQKYRNTSHTNMDDWTIASNNSAVPITLRQKVHEMNQSWDDGLKYTLTTPK